MAAAALRLATLGAHPLPGHTPPGHSVRQHSHTGRCRSGCLRPRKQSIGSTPSGGSRPSIEKERLAQPQPQRSGLTRIFASCGRNCRASGSPCSTLTADNIERNTRVSDREARLQANLQVLSDFYDRYLGRTLTDGKKAYKESDPAKPHDYTFARLKARVVAQRPTARRRK